MAVATGRADLVGAVRMMRVGMIVVMLVCVGLGMGLVVVMRVIVSVAVRLRDGGRKTVRGMARKPRDERRASLPPQKPGAECRHQRVARYF